MHTWKYKPYWITDKRRSQHKTTSTSSSFRLQTILTSAIGAYGHRWPSTERLAACPVRELEISGNVFFNSTPSHFQWSTLIIANSLNSPHISRTVFRKFGLAIYHHAKVRASKTEAKVNKIGLKVKANHYPCYIALSRRNFRCADENDEISSQL